VSGTGVRGSYWLVLVVASGCQIVGSYEEFDYTPAPAVPKHACDALPTIKNDEQGLSVMTRVNMIDGRCFWMDRTEVTVEQYASWQADVPADAVPWEPMWCQWKQDAERHDPIADRDDACRAALHSLDQQPFGAQKPMRCVDFCEAEAFCRWAGKHLCYDSSGIGVQGPRGLPQEWLLACSNQMATRYPWGNDDESHCNVGETTDACVDVSATCGPVTVGRNTRCSTPDGILDLLGNVSEWVFSCNFVDPDAPVDPIRCLTRGGGYDDPLRGCDWETTIASDTRKPSLGFRCCSDLSQPEQALVTRP
jgi:sulfatase modifying factor 1